MIILETLENGDLSLECPQCHKHTVGKKSNAARVRNNPDSLCASCTTSNRNRQQGHDKRQAILTDPRNTRENGVYIVAFPYSDNTCVVECMTCHNTYERKYAPSLFKGRGCKDCSRKLMQQANNKHDIVNHEHRLYSIFSSMRERTENPNHHHYKYYGGRGIKICDEWLKDRTKFYDWALANGYKDGLTIDRNNNNLGYSPDNCHWKTMKYQQRTTRRIQENNASGYRGVSMNSSKVSWRARIRVGVDKPEVHLGSFKTAKLAAYHYDKYVRENNLEHTRNFTNEEYNQITTALQALE